MPSVVLGNPYLSGAQLVFSGNPFSGLSVPTGGFQLRFISSGGLAYIALSGGGPPLSGGFMTINSGQMLLSGGVNSGMLDGFPLAPGDSYFIPKLVLGNNRGVTSGIINIFALCDQAASGVGRLSIEVF